MRRYSYLVAVVLMATVVVPILGVAPPALADFAFVSNPNVAIPDDGYVGVGDGNDGFGVDAGMVCDLIDTSGPVGAGATVTGVAVDLGLTHTWIGDVTVKLQSPDGTILAIMERVEGDNGPNNLGDDGTDIPIGDSSNLDGALLHFADGNSEDSESMGAFIGGSESVGTDDGVFDYFPNPDQALVVGSSVADFAAFNGGPAAGLWTLCVGDGNLVDTGTFETWTLQLGSTDVVDPVVTVVAPAVGDVFDLYDVVVADYECVDEPGGSGMASCDGDVADGAALDTSTLGAHSFTVTGTDNAGNSTVITHNYLVVDRIVPPAIDSEWLQIGGVDHMAVLLVDPVTEDTRVDVRKVSDGSLVSSVSFGSSYVGTDLETSVTVDEPEEAFLIVLGTRADYAVRATSKYAVSGALVGRANFGNVYSGTDLEVVAVSTLTSGPTVAVLGTSVSNQNVRVQTRRSDDSVLSTVYLGDAWTGDDLGRNFPNLGVLGTKLSNGNVRVRTINPFTGSVVDTAYWGNAFTGSDVEAHSDHWAVLQEKLTTGAVRVQTRTTAGAKVGTASFGLSTYVPTDLEVVAGDVAVLGTSTTNQAVRVQTRTVAGVLVGTSQYGTAYSGIDLEADSDLGVLGLKATNGKIRDQIRTTAGTVVATINYN